jgi:hypothetical protein
VSCPCDVVDVASGDRIRKAGDQPIAVIDESRDRALDEATHAVGIKVAERIINRREDFFGGLSSLTDLAGIPYLGADKFNDLLYSFHQTVYEVSGIEFNIASGSIANDGLSLRRNTSSTTSSPRWTRGHAFTH